MRWFILLFAVEVICILKWIKWKVVALAYIYYMEKNQYKQPSDEELAECTGFVIKNIFKDLTGH